jgi:hypothetical protein
MKKGRNLKKNQTEPYMAALKGPRENGASRNLSEAFPKETCSSRELTPYSKSVPRYGGRQR